MCEHIPNYTLLQDSYVIRDGVKIIGSTLWSDTSKIQYEAEKGMNDYRFIRHGPVGTEWAHRLTPAVTTVIHRTSVKYIEKEISNHDGPTIVVTHHAPSRKSLDPRYEGSLLNDAYATDLELAEWPDVWIHGHIHRANDYMHEGCNILCNPGGYSREYTGFEPLNNYFHICNGVYYGRDYTETSS